MSIMTSKKNLLPGGYLPPRLVRGKWGWYILHYVLEQDNWVRKKTTYNLNRIPDKKRRLERAREILFSLHQREAASDDGPSKMADLGNTPVIEAIEFAANLKLQSPKFDTQKSFRMIRNM